MKLKGTKIGNSLGVSLPKETIAKLRAEQGDELFVTETPDGIQLSTYDAGFEAQMTAMRAVMKKRRNALRELAK